MHGVVPAAGEGTRLRPLTDDRPKALVELGGRPLLAHCFETLLDLGVDSLVVVVGYRGDQIVDRFGDRYAGVPIEYAVQDEPVGLADAVLRAEPLVDGDFVLLNGDNVFDADLTPLLERHHKAEADATLLVDEVTTDEAAATGVLRFDDDGELSGIVEKPVDPPSTRVTRGCYVFSPAVFPACHLVQPTARGEYELSDAVDLLLGAGRPVETVAFEGRCVNVNTPADLDAAERLVAGRPPSTGRDEG
jgi:glucose-1-phosphate thymidylyltransferase